FDPGCKPRPRLCHETSPTCRRKAAVALVCPYVASSADPRAKEMALVVEATWVSKAVTTLEAHDQLPALARLRHQWGVVPRQQQARGDRLAGMRDVQHEAHVAPPCIGQGRHNTVHHQIRPL